LSEKIERKDCQGAKTQSKTTIERKDAKVQRRNAIKVCWFEHKNEQEKMVVESKNRMRKKKHRYGFNDASILERIFCDVKLEVGI
jgi:hypothetical protein